MGSKIPKVLSETMKESFVREALEQRGLLTGAASQIPVESQIAELWSVLSGAHNSWRQESEIRELILDEDCDGHINAFMCLELAGAKVVIEWGRKSSKLLRHAGFALEQAPCTRGYEEQMNWIEEVDFNHIPLISNAFVVHRRLFVGKRELAGYGDLLRYVSNEENDVLGIVYGSRNPAEERLAMNIRKKLYWDMDTSLSFRLANRVVVANGNTAPLKW